MKRVFVLLASLMLLNFMSCSSIEAPKVAVAEEEEELPELSEAQMRVLSKLGGEILPDKNIKFGNITIDRRKREISFPAKMCVTQGGDYGIEVLISLPNGRVHEALLVTDAEPMNLQLALYLIGAENGARMPLGDIVKQGSLINIDVHPENGERVPVEDWLVEAGDPSDEKSADMKRVGWVFVGSSYVNGTVCLAKEEGNVVNVMSCGNTILDNPSESGDSPRGVGVNEDSVPARNTPVTVYFSIAKPEDRKDRE